jgi:hypothetical protein
MNVHELREKFIELREYETDDMNELLDFAKRTYIFNEISICDYRNLVRELEFLGAVFPEHHLDHSLIENSI